MMHMNGRGEGKRYKGLEIHTGSIRAPNYPQSSSELLNGSRALLELLTMVQEHFRATHNG